MSWVTNVILIHSVLEIDVGPYPRDFPIISRLNAALEEAGIGSGHFVRVDPHAGGTKYMEAKVYLAAFNHLDDRILFRVIREMPWEEPDLVQVFIQRQEELRFTEVDLFGRYEPTRMHKMAAERATQLTGPPEQQEFLASLPAALEECRRMVVRIEANPLRTPPYHPTAAETQTHSPWLFEVLEIRPETTLEEGTLSRDAAGNPVPGTLTYKRIHTIIATLAYRGQAGKLRCSSEDVGDDLYRQLFDAMSGVDVGAVS
jgi:hypothetical protein